MVCLFSARVSWNWNLLRPKFHPCTIKLKKYNRIFKMSRAFLFFRAYVLHVHKKALLFHWLHQFFPSLSFNCFIYCMNCFEAITLESLQGDLYLVAPRGNPSSWDIQGGVLEGDKFHLRNFPEMEWNAVIDNNEFGFRTKTYPPMEQLFEPVGIMPGLIKLTMTSPQTGEVGYWVKNIDFPPQVWTTHPAR